MVLKLQLHSIAAGVIILVKNYFVVVWYITKYLPQNFGINLIIIFTYLTVFPGSNPLGNLFVFQ